MSYFQFRRLRGKLSMQGKATQPPLHRHVSTTLHLQLLEDRTVPSALLGAAANNFAVLGAAAVTNTGPTVIVGDLGVSPGTSITGFPPGSVTGTIHPPNDLATTTAQSEDEVSFAALAGAVPTANLTGQDLGGLTLFPGVYHFNTSAQLTGTLMLDGNGEANPTFIFQMGSTLTTASNSNIVFTNGAVDGEVYWQVGSSATLGTGTAFAGNIIAQASVTLTTGATILDGRALALTGAVTMDSNAITIPSSATLGSIAGQKFNDLNGDGIREPGEPPLAGVTFFLDANDNGVLDPREATAVSDVNGNYSFRNLVPGTYRVREVPQPGALETSANPADITLVSGQDVVGVNFGNFLLISISGEKFDDLNGDGIRGPNEPGLAGVTIFLDTNGNGLLDAGERSTVTDANGDFSFTNLGPGTYVVRELQLSGFTETTVNPADIVASSGDNIDGVLIGDAAIVIPPVVIPPVVIPPVVIPPVVITPVVGDPILVIAGGGQDIIGDPTPVAVATIGKTMFLGSTPALPADSEQITNSEVKIFNAITGAFDFGIFPYGPAFTGGIRVAVGDVNNDGIPDIITGPGPGGGPDIHVYNGATGALEYQFMAFNPNFTGGVFVAVGDVNGDGFGDIIVGADAGGGPNVAVFSGKDGSRLLSFMAFDPTFTGGVRVAAGDLDGTGRADIITAAGPGGGPQVKVFSGTLAVIESFFAYNPAFTGGVYVAAGDTSGTGMMNIITGAGAGGGPNVAVFDGRSGAMLENYFAFDPSFTGGVRVAAVDSGNKDTIFAVAGPSADAGGTEFSGLNAATLDPFFTTNPVFSDGLFAGASG